MELDMEADMEVHYIHTTFTLHLHIDGASSRSFERHFLISIAGEEYE